MKTKSLILFILYLLFGNVLFGQNNSLIRYQQPDTAIINVKVLQQKSKDFVIGKLKSLKQVAIKQDKKSRKVLKKLSKKEAQYLKSLGKKDSISLANLKSTPHFDSLKKMIHSNVLVAKATTVKSEFTQTIDSLKQITNFAKQKVEKANTHLEKFDEEINIGAIAEVEKKLDINQHLNVLIQKRMDALKLSSVSSGVTKGMKGLTKQNYYYKQKLNVYKQIATDPSILEEKALAYLQGMKGFEESFTTPTLGGSNRNQNASVADLEKMGFQTKRQVKSHMSKQFEMQTPEQIKEVSGKIKSAQIKIASAKSEALKLKESAKQLGFKPNPLRGLPMLQRLEKSFTWQVQPVTSQRPVVLEANGILGYKQTPRLTYQAVCGTSIGLGKDWQHIRLSFEGLRVGLSADWKLIWGISGQVGYERIYKQYDLKQLQLNENGTVKQIVTQTEKYQDIAYSGIQKTYKINSKYSGTILLAYDWLWKQGNNRSPIIWRVGWKK